MSKEDLKKISFFAYTSQRSYKVKFCSGVLQHIHQKFSARNVKLP